MNFAIFIKITWNKIWYVKHDLTSYFENLET
jgi:hypothetical protein